MSDVTVCFSMAALDIAGVFINITCLLVWIKGYIQKVTDTLSSFNLLAPQLQLICPLQSAWSPEGMITDQGYGHKLLRHCCIFQIDSQTTNLDSLSRTVLSTTCSAVAPTAIPLMFNFSNGRHLLHTISVMALAFMLVCLRIKIRRFGQLLHCFTAEAVMLLPDTSR